MTIGALRAHIGFPFADRGLHVRHLSSAFVSAKVTSKSGTRQYQFGGTAHEGGSGPFIDVKTGKVIDIVGTARLLRSPQARLMRSRTI